MNIHLWLNWQETFHLSWRLAYSGLFRCHGDWSASWVADMVVPSSFLVNRSVSMTTAQPPSTDEYSALRSTARWTSCRECFRAQSEMYYYFDYYYLFLIVNCGTQSLHGCSSSRHNLRYLRLSQCESWKREKSPCFGTQTSANFFPKSPHEKHLN